MFFLIFPRLLIEFFLDIIFFPLWWYTGGLWYALSVAHNLIAHGNANLSPGMWLKNLFVPMFGQHDFQGRMVSVLIRLLNVIFRSLALFLWMLVVFVFLLCWILIPLGIVYMILITLAA